MKKIEVSDEMYAKLVTLATEMTEQDPRGTRMPHLFQVRTDERVYDWSMNGDYACWIYDTECYDYHTKEDMYAIITEYCEGYDIPAPHIDDFDGYDMESWLEDKGFKQCSWSINHKYENAFFTAKGCQEHIKANKHNLANPLDYLNHAFRNPEMDLVTEFLCGLVGKEPHQ